MERLQICFSWASVAVFAAWVLFADAGKAREALQFVQYFLLGAAFGAWACRRRARTAGGVTDVR